MRRRVFEIIELSDGDKASAVYDYAMIVVIIASLIPLAYKETTPFLNYLDKITVAVFILDYLLRILTADYKLKKKAFSFLCIQLPLLP
jgi:voltage-gated potassium channel